MSTTCVSNDSHLLSFDKTYIAGYSCTSTLLFIFVNIFAVVLQVVRNIMWTKSGQIQRLALKEIPFSPARSAKTKTLLWYTLIQYLLYVTSFLLIVGGNLIILFSVGLGNLLGVYYSMQRQAADTSVRFEDEMVAMLDDYEDLSRSTQLTPEEEKEKEEMIRLQHDLRKFLSQSSYNKRQAQQASETHASTNSYKF